MSAEPTRTMDIFARSKIDNNRTAALNKLWSSGIGSLSSRHTENTLGVRYALFKGNLK